MPKEELKGLVTKHGEGVSSSSGRTYRWFTLNQGAKGAIRVIGFYPTGIGARCEGLHNAREGFSVRVTGVRRGSAFFADSVIKVVRSFGRSYDGPPAPQGPWSDTGTVVAYRPGKTKDWLEIVTPEGDQVPVTTTPGLLSRDCLGKQFKFTGKANRHGYRHGTEAQALDGA
jgi:hypothetical protein